MRDRDPGRIEFVQKKPLPGVIAAKITQIEREDHDFQKFEITLADGTIIRLQPSSSETVGQLRPGDDLIITKYECQGMSETVRAILDGKISSVVAIREGYFVTSFRTRSNSIEIS